jgi:hypothetical protein
MYVNDPNIQKSITQVKCNTWDEVQCIFLNNKCGHRNVLSKRQVWMSIFHIINFKKKKKSWTQGPGLVFLSWIIIFA